MMSIKKMNLTYTRVYLVIVGSGVAVCDFNIISVLIYKKGSGKSLEIIKMFEKIQLEI